MAIVDEPKSPSLVHLHWLAETCPPADDAGDVHVALDAAFVWGAIRQASNGQMPVPDACTGPDGEMFFSWDAGRHHLSVEILGDGEIELFYRDRQSPGTKFSIIKAGDVLPDWFVETTRLFGPGSHQKGG